MDQWVTWIEHWVAWAILTGVIVVVIFGALGLFWHLTSNRFDLLSQRIDDVRKRVDEVHDEIQSVSPLVATERVAALAEELVKAFRQIMELEKAHLQFREELRELEKASKEAISLLGGSVDRLREHFFNEIRLLKTAPKAKPGDVQGG